MNIITDTRLRALHRAIVCGDEDRAAATARELARTVPQQLGRPVSAPSPANTDNGAFCAP